MIHDFLVKCLTSLVGAALANSDRIKVACVTVTTAIFNVTALPALIVKVNSFCGGCVPPDVASKLGGQLALGVLALGGMLVHSIGNRDTVAPVVTPDGKPKVNSSGDPIG